MNESAQVLKSASRWGMIWGFLTILFGFFAIGSPFVSGLAVAMFIGIALLAAGISNDGGDGDRVSVWWIDRAGRYRGYWTTRYSADEADRAAGDLFHRGWHHDINRRLERKTGFRLGLDDL